MQYKAPRTLKPKTHLVLVLWSISFFRPTLDLLRVFDEEQISVHGTIDLTHRIATMNSGGCHGLHMFHGGFGLRNPAFKCRRLKGASPTRRFVPLNRPWILPNRQRITTRLMHMG
jgi:hypothetical protein